MLSVACLVDRGDDRLGELATFLDDLVDQVARDIGIAEVIGVGFDLQHIVQHEGQVADRRLIGHGSGSRFEGLVRVFRVEALIQ